MNASATSQERSGEKRDDLFVLHSHHYHAALLRVLYEASGIDAVRLLEEAVGVCDEVFAEPVEPSNDNALSLVVEGFRASGLGTLVTDARATGGTGRAELRDSHSATAWRLRYPPADRPVCGIASAALGRSLSLLLGEPRRSRELECAAMGAERCLFEVVPGELRAGEAAAATRRNVAHGTRGSNPPIPNNASGSARSALTDIDSPAEVFARAHELPGSPLVALPVDFYAAITHLFTTEIPRVRGAKFANLPGILLTEAAHRNGFHLFGEALEAQDLDGVDEATRAERLLDVLGRLRWGTWRIQSFLPGERLIVRASDSYEGRGHRRLFGRTPAPRCTVAGGALAALMNLLYRSPSEMPAQALTPSFYHTLFRNPHSFRAAETRCVAMGDAVCEIVVNPLTV